MPVAKLLPSSPLGTISSWLQVCIILLLHNNNNILQDGLPTLLRLNITPDVAGKVPLLPHWSYPESGKFKVSI